jgi:hypothetical protein
VTSWRGRNSDVTPCGRESGGPEVLVLGVQRPGMEGRRRRPGREGGEVQGSPAAGRRAVLLGDHGPVRRPVGKALHRGRERRSRWRCEPSPPGAGGVALEPLRPGVLCKMKGEGGGV